MGRAAGRRAACSRLESAPWTPTLREAFGCRAASQDRVPRAQRGEARTREPGAVPQPRAARGGAAARGALEPNADGAGPGSGSRAFAAALAKPEEE